MTVPKQLRVDIALPIDPPHPFTAAPDLREWRALTREFRAEASR